MASLVAYYVAMALGYITRVAAILSGVIFFALCGLLLYDYPEFASSHQLLVIWSLALCCLMTVAALSAHVERLGSRIVRAIQAGAVITAGVPYLTAVVAILPCSIGSHYLYTEVTTVTSDLARTLCYVGCCTVFMIAIAAIALLFCSSAVTLAKLRRGERAESQSGQSSS